MTFQTEVEFLAEKTERPVYYASSAGRDARHNINQQMKIVAVDVDDARTRNDNDVERECGLHPSGFDLLEFPTAVTNFLDRQQIDSVYESEVEAFLKAQTGCHRVHIFDHTVRASDPQLREVKNIREPATLVHNDYTSKSGFVCLQENLGEDAEALARGRFQIVNVWRPLVDPVEDFPLALCDARSIELSQLVDTERRAQNHTGEIQLAVHAPTQNWFYFSAMRPPEVLLFKTFDSINEGVNPSSIHSAIRLPDVAADAKPRESIESRAFIFHS